MSAAQTIDLLRLCKEVYERDTLVPDLDGTFGTKPAGAFSTIVTGATTTADRVFERDRVFALPPALVERVRDASEQVRMGFLRDVGCVWVAFDRELVLLDFEGSGRIVRLELPETVQFCTVFAPAPGTFSANARHLLAVATNNAVRLYAFLYPQTETTLDTAVDTTRADTRTDIRFDTIQTQTQTHAQPPSTRSSSSSSYFVSTRNSVFSRVVLSETGLVAPLPTGTLVTQLVATETGRVFAGLSNGALFELLYATEANGGRFGGFGRKNGFGGGFFFGGGIQRLGHARLVDRTSIPILSSIPFVGSLLAPRPIKQCVYDATRGLLYALHEDDRISPFLLDGSCVHSFQRLRPYTSLVNDLRGLLPEEARIVQIRPIPRHESASLCLQAMLENGFVVVFGLSTILHTRETLQITPEFLRDFGAVTGKNAVGGIGGIDRDTLSKARLAYRDCRRPFDTPGRCASFYAGDGVLLASFRDATSDRTRVYGMVREVTQTSASSASAQTSSLSSSSSSTRHIVQALDDVFSRGFDAQVVDVAEFSAFSAGPKILAGCLGASPALYQYARGPRTLIVVTNSAIVSYRILAPAHRLERLITGRPPEIARFRDAFDAVEFQCMVLHAAVENVLATGLPTAPECAAIFFQGLQAHGCTQLVAIRRYVARVLSFLVVYPYWRGVGDVRGMAMTTGDNDAKGNQNRQNRQNRVFARLRRLPVETQNSGQKSAQKSSPKSAQKNVRAVSVSHFQTRSAAAAVSSFSSASASSMPGAACYTAMLWTSEDLLGAADRLKALHAFLGAHTGDFAAYDAAVGAAETFCVIAQCIWNVQQAVRFLALALQPAHVIYTAGVLNRFAREHGRPVYGKDERTTTITPMTTITTPTGQYCELLTLSGFFEPAARTMIDEVLRVLSVGETLPTTRGSLLCATTLRKVIGANFMEQLQVACPDLFNVYSTRLSVLRQLEGTRVLPIELRTKQIREALGRMLAVPQAIEPVEPVINTLRSLDQYASAILLLLRSISADEIRVADAFLADDKDQLAQLAHMHAHMGHAGHPNSGNPGNPGNFGQQTSALNGQVFLNAAKTLSQALEQAFLTNRDQAFGCYRAIVLPPVNAQLVERFREVRTGLRDGAVTVPFAVDDGFSQILQRESALAGIDADGLRATVFRVCKTYAKTLELVRDGYLLAGIDEHLLGQGQMGQMTGGISTGQTTGGISTGGILTGISTVVGVGAESSHGRILAVIESAVRHSASRVWQRQLYAFLYSYYYASACILKAFRDGVPDHTKTYAVSSASSSASSSDNGGDNDIFFVLKTLRTRAEQALVLISSPFIEEFLHAQNYVLHARFLERRHRQLEASTVLYRRATAQKQPALFPAVYDGAVRSDFLSLEDRIDLLNEAAARLEYALLADTRTGGMTTAMGVTGGMAGILPGPGGMTGGILPGTVVGTGVAGTVGTVGTAGGTAIGPTINVQERTYPVYANPEGIEDFQATPQHLLKAIKDALIAASVQLVLLQRVRRLTDDGREKYIAALNTEGLLSLSAMRTRIIMPLRFCDMAVYMLLSSPSNAHCRAELANQWVGALSGKLSGFCYAESQFVTIGTGTNRDDDGRDGRDGRDDKIADIDETDANAINSIVRAAQVFRFILGLCASTERALQPGDYTLPLAVLALLVTSHYREYDVQRPYDRLSRRLVETLFLPGGPTIRENVVLANLLSGIDLVWKVLAPYEAASAASAASGGTQNLLEALPIPDLSRCSLTYLSRVLAHFGLALVARARAHNNLVADPLAQIVNLETVQLHARQILER